MCFGTQKYTEIENSHTNSQSLPSLVTSVDSQSLGLAMTIFIDCFYAVVIKFRASNQMGLDTAEEATAEFLNKTVKPVLIGGTKIHVAKADKAFLEWLTHQVAMMPSAPQGLPRDGWRIKRSGCHPRKAWYLRPTRGSSTPTGAPSALSSALKSSNLHLTSYFVPP